jgi:hypothetical protein
MLREQLSYCFHGRSLPFCFDIAAMHARQAKEKHRLFQQEWQDLFSTKQRWNAGLRD